MDSEQVYIIIRLELNYGIIERFRLISLNNLGWFKLQKQRCLLAGFVYSILNKISLKLMNIDVFCIDHILSLNQKTCVKFDSFRTGSSTQF